MQTKKIKHIAGKILTEITNSAHEVHKHSGKDSVHRLRVQFKKLRALMRLLSFDEKFQHILKIPAKLNRLYKLAGRIRDMQLELKEIRNDSAISERPGEYFAVLKKTLNKRIDAFTKAVTKTNFAKSKKKIVSKLPATLPLNNVQTFLNRCILEIHSAVKSESHTDENLHIIRKKIKDIIFINDIYSDLNNKHHKHTLLKKEELRNAHLLTEELGKFIDKKVSLSYLQAGWLRTIPSKEKQQLQIISHKWTNDKIAKKGKAISSIKTSFFHNTPSEDN